MLFTSYTFVAFLVLLFALYYGLPLISKKFLGRQWIILLVGSYAFYAFSGVENLAFILFCTAVCFVCGIIIDAKIKKEDAYIRENRERIDKDARKAYRAKAKKKRLLVLLLGLVLNLGMLAVIKYSAFALSNINLLASAFGAPRIDIPSFLLPMGISFYVFQSTGYLVDVYRGKTSAEKNPARFALFVSFFPQLVQGPISRHNALAAELYAPHPFDPKALKFGLQRVLWGYFKKLVIADRILIAMKTLLADTQTYDGVYVALLILLYSVEIYADFTGGIDITIGIAQALGIRLAENFNHPFSSTSTKEYWNRWHMTMGTWFTDYVFNPLSVCRPMLKLSKASRRVLGVGFGKRISVYISTVVTWFLTGLWHGAAWNFIVWGLLNCAVILISRELEGLYRAFRTKFPRLCASYAYHCFGATRTFLLMGLIRSLDCYRDVPTTFRMWGSMLKVDNLGEFFGGGMLALGLSAADFIILAVSVTAVAVVAKLSSLHDLRESLYNKTVLSWVLSGVLIIAILLFGIYGIGYDSSQFIYNQF